MSKLTSGQLQETQNVLEQLAKNEIDSPMTDYSKVNRLMKTIEEIDSQRRKAWNGEKFGSYEKMVDNVLDANFTADDIPF